MNKEDIREVVRQRYAKAITTKSGCSCGSGSCCGGTDATKAITGNLYDSAEVNGLPAPAVEASLGCGNPTALAPLHPGETVLDLGSGAGLDVLLSARRVGPYGKAYGLDMTDEMLAAANANKEKAGAANVEFLKGYIEDIPLPDNSVDVVISNCVINLSADKTKVMSEIFRVLKPGGRVAVSDIVTTKELPDRLLRDLTAWAGCIAGALTDAEYRSKLTAAGFDDIELLVTSVYDLATLGAKYLPDMTADELADLNGALVSAFVRAKKPSLRLAPGSDYTLRPAAAADLPGIKLLLAANGLPSNLTPESLTAFLVAEQQTIIGVIGLEIDGSSALLRSMAVASQARKAGVAAALVAGALQVAQHAGVREIYLLTETAATYFAKCGFTSVERAVVPPSLLKNSGLDRACPTSSTCMRLTL